MINIVEGLMCVLCQGYFNVEKLFLFSYLLGLCCCGTYSSCPWKVYCSKDKTCRERSLLKIYCGSSFNGMRDV